MHAVSQPNSSVTIVYVLNTLYELFNSTVILTCRPSAVKRNRDQHRDFFEEQHYKLTKIKNGLTTFYLILNIEYNMQPRRQARSEFYLLELDGTLEDVVITEKVNELQKKYDNL